MNSGVPSPAEWQRPELPLELKSLEARLSALCPRDDRIDRERLMFLAGQASIEAPTSELLWRRRAWPAAFAAMTAVAAALLVMLVTRPVGPVRAVDDAANVANGTPATEQSVPFAWPPKTGVLSAGDAHRRDVEALLSAPHVAFHTMNESESPPVDEPAGSVLTPAAWRQVFPTSNPINPFTGRSSALPRHQGITS